jgi:hypothetical protein
MKTLTIIKIVLWFQSACFAANRISETHLEKKSINRIEISPGLVSVLRLRCNVEVAFVGNENEVTVSVNPVELSSIIISSKSTLSEPTNLIVKCKKRKDYFVFDLIPNNRNHQDVIESSFLGGSEFIKIESKTQNTKMKSQIIEVKKPTLIKKGGF